MTANDNDSPNDNANDNPDESASDNETERPADEAGAPRATSSFLAVIAIFYLMVARP